ncbi:phosphate ABC transporter substrate-binding protein PstS [Pararoseomonas sp. SCSIO 73927]|uniref:phosphate ABC transporter substrate-binding protein PstS n=1 Tax=Pararoseomonas sp. SCSIO 73927 TaxID=3114537 RepID=UPI0030D17228
MLVLSARPALADGLAGAGSTFAHPLLARWGQVYSSLQGEGGSAFAVDGGFDYEPVGSMGGIMRVLQGAVDFGATDVPMPAEEVERHRLAQFPIATGGVAVVTNIRGVGAGALRLSAPILARIYLGEVTRWSDPSIAALNPGLRLPEATIAVVHRSDRSGTTWHFTNYLSGGSPEWRSRIGAETLPRWPVGTGLRGSSAVADRVGATENSIGYVEAGQAAGRGLAVALVENRAGRFVAPTLPALRDALASTRWDPAQHFAGADAGPVGEEAYPITATVFVVAPRQPASAARGRHVAEFFRMALTERAEDAAALGLVPLPEAVVRQVSDYWRAAPAAAR